MKIPELLNLKSLRAHNCVWKIQILGTNIHFLPIIQKMKLRNEYITKIMMPVMKFLWLLDPSLCLKYAKIQNSTRIIQFFDINHIFNNQKQEIKRNWALKLKYTGTPLVFLDRKINLISPPLLWVFIIIKFRLAFSDQKNNSSWHISFKWSS